MATGAGLEALPGAVRHRSGNDPVEGADRAIEPRVGVGEKLRAASSRRIRTLAVSDARRMDSVGVLAEAMAKVREGDRSQTFADGERASRVIAGETAILREEAPIESQSANASPLLKTSVRSPRRSQRVLRKL